MVHRYEIRDVSVIDGYSSSFPRNVTLRVGNRSLNHLSKCTEVSTDLRTLEDTGDRKVLNECYVDLSLTRLRELDSNRAAQDQYLFSRSKFLDKDMVNVLVLKLYLEEDDVLDDQDYEYLNSILSWGCNDIYVMPLLEFRGRARTDMVTIYNDFVERMLAEKASWAGDVNVGMSIPRMYPRRSIGDLFGIYSDEAPTFVAVDLDNSRMVNPGDVTGAIMEHFQREHEENVFLYGVNVKPYRRNSADTSAWDIYMVHGAFNAIGPVHHRPDISSLPPDWNGVGRMFDREDVGYHAMDSERFGLFSEWMDEKYGMEVVFGRNEVGQSLYLKRYNFQQTNNLLLEFSSAIREGDRDYVDRMVDLMPEEMRGVDIMECRGRRVRRSECTGYDPRTIRRALHGV